MPTSSIYQQHVKPALGSLRVREVDTPVVDWVLMAIKPKTVSGARTARIVLSALMRLVARHGAVTINPVREVARIDVCWRLVRRTSSGCGGCPRPSRARAASD